MISSMTGFGRAEVKENGYSVSVEMRSLNHRFLDVEIRLPKNLIVFEAEVRELINRALTRGRVSATITIKGEHISAATPTVDRPLAAAYLNLLNQLKKDLKLDGAIELGQLLSFPEILSFDNSEKPDRRTLSTVRKSVEIALADLQKMRRREGREIRKDLVSRVKSIDRLIGNIQKDSKRNASEYYQKLKDRVKEIADVEGFNEGRLEMEVAVLAEKSDVTEECIRFKSHDTMFLELLAQPTSSGRKLNFLLQEMHREANTIGAKANDAKIAHWVVEIKEEVEKLREQIQNIE